ncbi:hypothetical protein [Rhodococcus sp. SG20037]|uniref:hypothetical protein n=1 Tax=Rhodococcus sp. SG20037 TaxID=3074148 RepID=UPI00287FD172|nr:hypothetical protein [Rhodococcus sp. SG20037]WNF39619.1 hypothetical protein RHP72_17535 [Rhodococcus sp. SG20037]
MGAPGDLLDQPRLVQQREAATARLAELVFDLAVPDLLALGHPVEQRLLFLGQLGSPPATAQPEPVGHQLVEVRLRERLEGPVAQRLHDRAQVLPVAREGAGSDIPLPLAGYTRARSMEATATEKATATSWTWTSWATGERPELLEVESPSGTPSG